MKKFGLWLMVFSLVVSAFIAPVVPVSKAYAAGGTIYEAEAGTLLDATVKTSGSFSGNGYVDLGDKANGASVTWNNIQADFAGNYVVNIKYSNVSQSTKPVSLIVNGQKYATFQGEPTGGDAAPVWSTLNAVVMLNQGINKLQVISENADGPEIDVLEVTSYATIFEAENGAGAAHLDATIAANTGTAPGFSGTGYVSVATPKNGYLLYNNVVVPETGKYTLKVRYSLLSGPRPFAVTVNGARIQDAKGIASGGWNIWKYEELTGISLNAGVNTLKIERIGTNSTPVIDRFEIVSEQLLAVGDQTFRNTTFESSDADPVIAGTATGEVLNSPLISGTALKSTSGSIVKVADNAGSRGAEITTPQAKQGIIGFPFHSSWNAPVPMASYTLESSFVLKDDKANYIFKLINAAASMESPIFVFSMDGKIYARSDNKAGGALAERASWSAGTAYKVKLVFHVDTKSYDMYLNGIKLVNSEPLQDDVYSGGLKGFFMEVTGGPHQETKILVDDITLSGSNTPGTAPVINPNPGAIYVEQAYIGAPVNYYVSPAGLDTNDGLSTGKAFKTISKAASVTNPGDTVLIMPGTYSPAANVNDFVNITRSGARDAKTGISHYITYKAYDPNQKPKLLLPPNVSGVWDMVQISANYIIIDGIEIEGNNRNLTLAQGEANYASKVAGGSDWNNYALTNTNGISLVGHHITVKNSHVHHMAGGGIGGNGDYVVLDNNISNSNSWYTMYATSGISMMNNFDTDNNTTDYKIIVSNNLIYDNETKVKWEKTKGYSDGNGIIFDVDDDYKGKKLAVNNIVYDNGGGGIHVYRSNNVSVINNTIYNNSRSPYLTYPNMDAQSSDNSFFLNNISYARPGENANLDSGFNNLFANNIYFGGNARFLGQNDRVLDPKFVSLEEGNYDFHLQADSPAIDNGTRTLAPSKDIEGQVRPYTGAGSHSRVDIGAYETAWNNTTPLVDDSIIFKEPTPDQSLEAKATKGTPTLDGVIDPIWSKTESFKALKISDVTKEAPEATMRLLWDEKNLYVLAEVKDANLSVKGANLWEHDSMEFFMDENNAKSKTYQPDDGHYRVNYENLRTGGSGGKKITASSFTSAARIVEGGYIIEATLPLTTITGSIGTVIGFDAGASDDSNDDGIRDNATMWSNQRFNSHASTQWYGNITFADAPKAPTITSIQPVAVSTPAGKAPILPSVVSAVYSDDSSVTVQVYWDTVEPARYASAGNFTVNGSVYGTDIKAVANVTVTPVTTETPRATEDVSGPVNGVPDGTVNLYDLLFVTLNYGKNTTSPNWAAVQKGDVNKDGVIDIFDLKAIALKIIS
ncbi:sugar-binding protein [Paenibacillus swuensis]|uniref:sugar-binding protein n=1 Tax=Paenibacillus swuensis TaxID=1178515 RepID=UPI000AC0A44D|nr:sugar-binding protein [Paenibacillus swuensis]